MFALPDWRAQQIEGVFKSLVKFAKPRTEAHTGTTSNE